MKWACGCLVGVVLLVGMGLVVTWLLLNRWDSGKSGWRHLPPGTTVALETHDVKALLDHGFADPGIQGLIDRKVVPFLSGQVSTVGETFNELLDAYQVTGFLYRVAAPNSGVVGECLGFPGERFFIVQMPPWLRFFMNATYPGNMPQTYDTDESFLHFGHRDGFLVVAASPELVAEILDQWDSGANPLGAPPEGDGPRLYMAKRPETTSAGSDAGVDQPGHFMFADPFAPAGPGGPAATAGNVNEPFATRLSLTPTKAGWILSGESAPGDSWLGPDDPGLSRSLRNVLGTDSPIWRGGREIGLVARLDATPDVMEYLRRTSARYARDASIVPGEFRKDLAVKWLHDAWLASASNVWHLAVRRPELFDPSPTFPPLPVITVGWRVRDTTTPDSAAQAYGMALAEWLDGLKAEHILGGRLDLDSLIRYRLSQNDNGRGGRITIPPILLNGAAPAWYFDIASGDAWFATDPSGVPPNGGADALNFQPGDVVRISEDGLQVVIQGEWNFDSLFLREVFDLVNDRFMSLPMRYRMPWLERNTPPFLLMFGMQQLLTTYPSGAFVVQGDFDTMRVRFTSHIPYGNK